MFRLRLDQPARRLRPVAEEVRAGMRRDILDHRLLAAGHAVDGAVGELGERHGGWIDALPLCAPFVGDGLGQRPRRQHERRLARRPYTLPVEEQGRASRLILDGNALVEPARKTQFFLRGIGSGGQWRAGAYRCFGPSFFFTGGAGVGLPLCFARSSSARLS